MMSINPFSILAETVSPLTIQIFVLAMLALIVVGTVIQMIHHKNITYFFNNAKKAKLAAERELGVVEKTSVILKTVVHDIATTAELGAGKRRVPTYLECTALFYFGLHQSCWYFVTQEWEKPHQQSGYDLACWSDHDLCWWILVLVIFKSGCIS